MNRLLPLILLFFVSVTSPAFCAEDNFISMSTTTSTENSGLLDWILPRFTSETGIMVRVMAKGTGAAMRDGMEGNVDVILVHDRAREERFVADGFGAYRLPVMHNDFVVVGPPSDPAGVRGMKDAPSTLRAIAQKKQLFVSRGDESGTHAIEQSLWRQAGVPLKRIRVISGPTPGERFNEAPEGEWYISIGQGMGRTLMFADEKQAYTISDRATFLRHKFGKTQKLDLEILFEGDEALYNYYAVIPINPKRFPHVKFDKAEKFAKWLVSPEGQALIAGFRISGNQAFFPDAPCPK